MQSVFLILGFEIGKKICSKQKSSSVNRFDSGFEIEKESSLKQGYPFNALPI